MNILITIGSAIVLAAGAVLFIGQSPPEFVPMPRPRPAIAAEEPLPLEPIRVRSIPITKETEAVIPPQAPQWVR